MTKQVWLSCDDYLSMIESIRQEVSPRKLRLFTCACCRRNWNGLSTACQEAICVAESHADCQTSDVALELASDRAIDATRSADEEAVWWATQNDIWDAVRYAPFAAAGREVAYGWPGRNDRDSEQYEIEMVEACGLLRDIYFPLAFRPACNAGWLSSNVLDLARTIYEERDFERLPILADALMDAGCTDEDILNHCRSEGPHVRGCWVVDLILSKE